MHVPDIRRARALTVWRVMGLGTDAGREDPTRSDQMPARHDVWRTKTPEDLTQNLDVAFQNQGPEDLGRTAPKITRHAIPPSDPQEKTKAPRQDLHPSAPALTIRKDQRQGQTMQIPQNSRAIRIKNPVFFPDPWTNQHIAATPQPCRVNQVMPRKHQQENGDRQ